MYKEIPRRTFSINISSLIQTVLSVLEFHQISHRKRFLTTGRGLLPPVGTFTRPRRTYSILVTVYANLACPVKSHLQMSRVGIYVANPVLVVAVIAMIALPILLFFVFRFVVKDAVLLGIIMIVTAMPTASNITLLCNELGSDGALVAKGTFIGTIASLASIPLLVGMLL